ncbi:MAG TPA: 16S rRNA (adenine(1518)-N(6)/adenine(1519)-N(6))-dimethyltransferase RsmA [Corynebacteriales bacterium]|nr:16S rRNA (adenine(1518)-N(6)/adenine(1519)-N(6))-dimethyltransferase RsmA [Mycobacteriales bacterium]
MEENSTTRDEVTLLTAPEIRELADKLDIRPTKKLGQNFVIDPNTVRRIVAAADIQPEQTVLEIGPGLGSLTLALAEVGAKVTAIEIDPALAAELPHTFARHAPNSQLQIIAADALQVTAEQIAAASDTPPTALVANLPYNVAVPVLLHILEIVPSITTTLVMVQAEVADRLAAQPGSKTYGVPSVKAGFYGTVSKAGSIGRNVFWPAPNVDSGLVRIDAYTTDAQWDPFDQQLHDDVWRVVDAAFAQRRKTLRAALKQWAGDGDTAAERLQAAGIDPTLRGEKLSTADYVRLARS